MDDGKAAQLLNQLLNQAVAEPVEEASRESCEICRSAGTTECELVKFKEFVLELDSRDFAEPKNFRNHCYYAYAKQPEGMRGSCKRWKVPPCCHAWLQETYPCDSRTRVEVNS